EATARGRIITGEQGGGDVFVGTSDGNAELFVVAGGSLVVGGQLVVGDSGFRRLELDENAALDASVIVTRDLIVRSPLPPAGLGTVSVVGDPATDLSSLSASSVDVEHGNLNLGNGARMATTTADIGTDPAAHATSDTTAAGVNLRGTGTDPASLAATRWQIGI